MKLNNTFLTYQNVYFAFFIIIAVLLFSMKNANATSYDKMFPGGICHLAYGQSTSLYVGDYHGRFYNNSSSNKTIECPLPLSKIEIGHFQVIVQAYKPSGKTITCRVYVTDDEGRETAFSSKKSSSSGTYTTISKAKDIDIEYSTASVRCIIPPSSKIFNIWARNTL